MFPKPGEDCCPGRIAGVAVLPLQAGEFVRSWCNQWGAGKPNRLTRRPPAQGGPDGEGPETQRPRAEEAEEGEAEDHRGQLAILGGAGQIGDADA